MPNERPTIMSYLDNQCLGRAYLQSNRITQIMVEKHHLGDPGFQLWESHTEGNGWPTDYRLKRNAVKDAKAIVAAFPELTLTIS